MQRHCRCHNHAKRAGILRVRRKGSNFVVQACLCVKAGWRLQRAMTQHSMRGGETQQKKAQDNTCTVKDRDRGIPPLFSIPDHEVA
jgi:hypothetical protein